MSAADTPLHAVRPIPGYIAKQEADAVYAWTSTRRLHLFKGEHEISLSADDLRRLMQFVDINAIEEQL